MNRVETRFTQPTLSLYQVKGDARSLPELIDFHARVNPRHRFCIQVQDDAEDVPLLDVTYAQLKQAILRCQSWLCQNVAEIQIEDGGAKERRPVGLLMDSDLTLVIYLFALMSLGIPTVLLSARLSAEAVRHLVQSTRTGAILVSARLDGTAGEALSSWNDADDSPPPSKYSPAAYKDFLAEEVSSSLSSAEFIDRNVSHANHFVSESDRNVLILHSSGTTGLPKPIYTSHRHYLGFALCHEFKNEEEMLSPVLSTSPLFHGFGLLPPCLSLGVGKPFCLAKAGIIFTGRSTAQLLQRSGAKSLLTVPSIVEEIALLPDNEGIHALQPLHFVAFGGGLPKESIGDRLTAAGVKLLNHYGATETGPLAPLYVPQPGYDWHYFKLRTDTRDALRVCLEPIIGGDENQDGLASQWKLSLQPLGWAERFPIQDILVARPSPGSDNEYTVLGRSDDLIRLATGEKVRPTIVESMLVQSEVVKAAVAFGDGQFEIGVLIEPTFRISAVEEEDALKTTLWPIIQQAGEKMDSHARISSPQAIVLVQAESLPRSDKGTVLRKEVYQRFEKEIAEVYRKLDTVIDYSVPQLRVSSLEGDLRKLISDSLKWSNNSEWTDERDFFELGMNSLQATILRRLLVSSLRDGLTKVSIGRDFVYQHPSVAKLAKAVREGCQNQAAVEVDGGILEEFIDTYSLQRQRQQPNAHADSGAATVLLTGGTGSLGSHFLADLIRNPAVRCVVCLNRPSTGKQDPHERQAVALKSKGIRVLPEKWSKITVLEANTSSFHLGLSEADYTSLCERITHIVHNAWPMNFKMHVSSYESQFRALQNLLQLARDAHAHQQGTRRPRLLFISSISVVGRYGKLTGETFVPEMPIGDSRAALNLGYAQAKLVCEKIIERARSDFGAEIEAGYVRIGQIAGAAQGGFWNADEHFASLVASSEAQGQLPAIRGTLSWLPVDLASAVLAEIIFNADTLELIYHLENPVRQPWNEVLDIMASELDVDKHNRRPMAEWVEEVRRRPLGDDSNPAATIADFFQENFEWMSDGSVVLSTETSRRHSPTLRRAGPVQDEAIRRYLHYWRSIGLIRQLKD
ncbi:putative NRPS-like enzyme [Aspergillus germanicus]